MSGRERRKRSAVWEVFESPADGRVKCKKCSEKYKYSGNTSTLMTHIKNKHPGSVEMSESESENNKISSQPSTSAAPHPRAAPSAPSSTSKKQLRQTRLTMPKKFLQKSGDDALLNMIVKDFQPFQIVENEGFRQYSKALNADYELPSRKKLVQLLEERFAMESEGVKKQLKEVDHIALTSDIWSSDSNNSFISITAHFICNDKLKSLVIATAEMHESHTSENIAIAIQQILDSSEINLKIVTIVTDNASSMKKAVSEHLNKRNHFCVAHTLNLAVKDCIEKDIQNVDDDDIDDDQSNSNTTLRQLLSKCRSLVSHFKHSVKSSYALRDMQVQLKCDQLKLKQDVRTRWNSTFYMLDRLIKIKVPLSATLPLLETAPSNWNSNEWHLIEDVVMLLHPFETVTTYLSGEKYPSLSSVIPIVFGLQQAVNSKQPATEQGKLLQRTLAAVIEKRLGVYESNRTAAKATFLDPRFKKKAFGFESNANNSQSWVTYELKDYLADDSANQQQQQRQEVASCNLDSSTIANTVTVAEDEIWEIIDKKIIDASSQATPFSSAALMVKQYVELPYVDRKSDPLEFWREKKSLFPALHNLAQKYLCIPATSVPSERLFSKAGILCNDRRNRLAPKKVNDILFLNSIRNN